jgi:hypothetical protein
MPGGDMASFAARLSIGRWAIFRRRAGVPADRPRASLEYLITIVAVDENVEMAAAWTAIPRFHSAIELSFICTNVQMKWSCQQERPAATSLKV